MKKKLQKIVTRFYYPITLEAWYIGATKELEKVIGIGFIDIIMKFDGEKLEIFRIAEDLAKVKKNMLEYASSSNFEKKLRKYEDEITKFDQIIKQGENIEEAVNYFARLYPLYGVSYYVSNLWPDELTQDKKRQIINICKTYRRLSEGILNKLDSFVANYLKKRSLSLFTTREELEKNQIISNLRKGYIFSKGKFLNISWNKFLSSNNFSFIEKEVKQRKTLKGQIASPGKVKGISKLIFSPLDFHKIRKDEILISPMTQPTFVPILGRVSGIVTDEGGITCHAAIVSRELNIPCIIGTKVATRTLKDGDFVEVDANEGVVHPVKCK